MARESARPSVYVGTYGKYLEGSIAGAWLNPGDYESIEDFFSACADLHKDEEAGTREFMFQDYDNFPGCLASEGWFTPQAFAYCKAWDQVEEYGENVDAFEAYAELFGVEEDDADVLAASFEDAYYGEFLNDTEMAEAIVDESGMLSDVPDTIAWYFDYEKYARDLMISDFWEKDHFYFHRY